MHRRVLHEKPRDVAALEAAEIDVVVEALLDVDNDIDVVLEEVLDENATVETADLEAVSDVVLEAVLDETRRRPRRRSGGTTPRSQLEVLHTGRRWWSRAST